MPVSLDRALRPTEFADAWAGRQRQSGALELAAGKDGRLTRSTAERLASAPGVEREAADDLVAFFDRTGQKSVGVNKFFNEQHAFIVDSATAVAGANGLLSRLEARSLPVHLREDYLAVRGRAPASPVAEAPPAIKRAIESAALNVNNPSESDAPYRFFFAANPQHAAITPDLVVTLLAAKHDELSKDIFGPNTSLPQLVGRDFETVPAAQYFAHYANGVDPADPASVANNDKLQNLGTVLSQQLTNLVVIRFGDTMLRPTVPNFHGIKGAISGFVIGNTPSGDVAGVFTGYVET